MKLYENNINIIVSVAVILIVTACATGSSIPEDHFYRLPLLEIRNETFKRVSGSLAVDNIDAEGLYRERAILYVNEERPLELKRYHYRYWSYDPSHLVHQYLLDYLRQINYSDQIYGSTKINSRFTVDGKILSFERIVADSAISILITLELTFLDNKKDPLLSRVYTRRLEVGDTSMHSTADTFGVGLQYIFQKFISDINQIENL